MTLYDITRNTIKDYIVRKELADPFVVLTKNYDDWTYVISIDDIFDASWERIIRFPRVKLGDIEEILEAVEHEFREIIA